MLLLFESKILTTTIYYYIKALLGQNSNDKNGILLSMLFRAPLVTGRRYFCINAATFLNYEMGNCLQVNTKGVEKKVVPEFYELRPLSATDLALNNYSNSSFDSQILNKEKICKINAVLPSRAEANHWTKIYSTAENGFSLRTLYRCMKECKETSPTLLVIDDSDHHTFGALLSEPVVPTKNFVGTGETLLFTFHPQFKVYRWTGLNNLFWKGSLDCLCIGAGEGRFGLWLDADLYHGRTQECSTFGNAILTSNEDFLITKLEAWTFVM